MKVYIDIGHGERTATSASDPGAVSGGHVEHNMNIVTGNALAERLQSYGYDVMVEQGNLPIDASARAANAWGANLLISCHYNAGGGKRGEVIHSIRAGSKQLASAVTSGLKAAGQGIVNVYYKLNSTKTADYFGILRNSIMPAVIVEPCFIDNASDINLADTEEKQRYIGFCIADAVASVYGGKGASSVETWKTDIMNQAMAKELITQPHPPDEPAPKWFILAVCLNLLKIMGR